MENGIDVLVEWLEYRLEVIEALGLTDSDQYHDLCRAEARLLGVANAAE